MPVSNSAIAGRGIKPWVSLRAHPRLAAAVLLLVLLLGIPFAWFKGTPQYVASGSLYVSPRFIKNLKDDQELDFQSNSQYRQYVEQQVNSLRRHDVLAAALKNFPQDLAGWTRKETNQRKVIGALQNSLRIRAVPDTYLIEVSLAGDKPAGLAESINAVLRSYLVIAQTEDIYAADKRVRNLQLRQKELLQQVAGKNQRRTAIAEELGVTTFIDSQINPYDQLLVELQSGQQAAKQKLIEAQAQFESFSKRGTASDNSRAVAEIVQVDPGLNSLKANLNQRRASLVSQISGLTERHPARIAAEQEIADIERELAQQENKLTGSVVAEKQKRYQSAVLEAQQVLDELNKVIEQQRQRSSRYSTLYNEALNLNADVGGIRKEMDDITQRIGFLQLESTAPGFVRLNSLALPPYQPSEGGRRKLLIMVLLLAPLAALLAPIALDMSDRRLHNVNDLHGLFGFAPTGWIVQTENAATERFAIDQYRRLAANVAAGLANGPHQTLLLSSAKPGGGTSTLALRLGKTLSQLGKRTLVIELNAFSSDARYGEQPDVRAWLSNQQTAANCIAPANEQFGERMRLEHDGQHNLGFMPALLGRLPELQQQFDIILLDTPPILLSADTEILIRELRQAMLVTEALGINRGEALRAGRVMEKLGPELFAVVLNRVPVYHGGGYLAQLVEEFNSGQKTARLTPAQRLRRVWQQYRPRWPQGITRS